MATYQYMVRKLTSLGAENVKFIDVQYGNFQNLYLTSNKNSNNLCITF
jgi:hypothetical protein